MGAVGCSGRWWRCRALVALVAVEGTTPIPSLGAGDSPGAGDSLGSSGAGDSVGLPGAGASLGR